LPQDGKLSKTQDQLFGLKRQIYLQSFKDEILYMRLRFLFSASQAKIFEIIVTKE